MTDKVLLVGINQYPGAPLSGCVNDITDMADFLVKSCKVKPASIRMLVDQRATTKEIKNRLTWLVSDLKAGDRILFHYSGHGAQVATRDLAGEPDGLLECICPVEFDWTEEHMITDKDFNTLFSGIPEGVTANWISDSCHSGDLTREIGGLGGRTSKAMRAPADIAWRIQSAKEHGIAPTAKAAANVALIAGCRSDQTSADAWFKQGVFGCKRANGALSFYLLQELKKNASQAMPDLIVNVQKALLTNRYSQVPQLEGEPKQRTVSFMKQL